ncbi:MAG TPA: ferritin-like domain-containing protein, partial [Thermoanaerobaculia bacterium]|nr:ferritin-like domain-containing protein [Thermoanaerobaculia bacterium]
IQALREAAEIEQQLMVQYLYAAFSLKKRPDERCTAAQFELVRRWGSTLLMVARQEMEHLALVNGILTALGADPYFGRENIPRQSRYYLGANLARERAPSGEVTPCDIPFVFERFGLATIGRFVCAESPGYDTLKASGDPIPAWCFGTPECPCGSHSEAEYAEHKGLASGSPYPLARTHLAPPAAPAGQAESAGAAHGLGGIGDIGDIGAFSEESVRPGTIQALYDEIQAAINTLPDLFTGNPNQQVFVLVEYQINIFPVTDVASANLAIELIVEEGEGIDAPPGFQSHFRRFYDIRQELAAELGRDPGFEPSLPLPKNPRRDEVTDPFARRTFDLFNYAYATVLFVLTSLYKNFVPVANQTYPYFSSALQETAFGPAMTMLLRPIAEVLAYTRSGDGHHTTGPDYHLSAEDEAILTHYDAARLGNIDFFLERFGHIIAELSALSGANLAAVARSEDDLPFLRRQLHYVLESATAMANNLRRIYQTGQLTQFVIAP